MKAYLAGAMEYAPDKGCGWREEMSHFLQQELGHDVYNPCVEERIILTEEEWKHFRSWKTTDWKRFQKTVRKLIDADLHMLLHQIDYVICLWDQYSLRGGGTHGELTLCYFHKIPVYMVAHMPLSEISSWILGCVTEVFPDFASLKKFLRKKFAVPGFAEEETYKGSAGLAGK